MDIQARQLLKFIKLTFRALQVYLPSVHHILEHAHVSGVLQVDNTGASRHSCGHLSKWACSVGSRRGERREGGREGGRGGDGWMGREGKSEYQDIHKVEKERSRKRKRGQIRRENYKWKFNGG